MKCLQCERNAHEANKKWYKYNDENRADVTDIYPDVIKEKENGVPYILLYKLQ